MKCKEIEEILTDDSFLILKVTYLSKKVSKSIYIRRKKQQSQCMHITDTVLFLLFTILPTSNLT